MGSRADTPDTTGSGLCPYPQPISSLGSHITLHCIPKSSQSKKNTLPKFRRGSSSSYKHPNNTNHTHKMDDYTREMMDLKTLVTRTLEKKGVLAKIRAELRASVFEAIEEEDKVIEKDEGLPPALLGSCNDRARQLHGSSTGRLLTALICEYLEWAQLNHTLKVYLPQCNLQKDDWKAELKGLSNKYGYDTNQNGDSGPLLLDVLAGFLKVEVCCYFFLTTNLAIYES
ncbi:putative transcription factor interactor and regulator LisH family [Helianthus anomalus]